MRTRILVVLVAYMCSYVLMAALVSALIGNYELRVGTLVLLTMVFVAGLATLLTVLICLKRVLASQRVLRRHVSAQELVVTEASEHSKRAARQALLAQRHARSSAKSIKGISAAVSRLDRNALAYKEEFAHINRRLGRFMARYPQLWDEATIVHEERDGT